MISLFFLVSPVIIYAVLIGMFKIKLDIMDKIMTVMIFGSYISLYLLTGSFIALAGTGWVPVVYTVYLLMYRECGVEEIDGML